MSSTRDQQLGEQHPDLPLGQVGAQAVVRAAAAEGHVVVRAAGQVEAVRVGEHPLVAVGGGPEHGDGEVGLESAPRPPRCGPRRCAGGRATGLDQRRISSTAVSISSGSARRPAICSGCASSVRRPMAMALRVVSEPAMARMRNQRSSSISVSGGGGAVVEGRAGRARASTTRRRSGASRRAVAQPAGVGHPVDRGRPWNSLRGTPGLRVPRPQHGVDVGEHRGPVVDGDADDVGDHVQRQQVGDLGHEVAAVRGRRSSRRCAAPSPP